MSLILIKNTAKKSDSKNNRLQKEFESLSKALEREERSFKTFQSDMERLVQVYFAKVVPELKKTCAPMEVLTERLIVMAGRKSLAKWHREELDTWISELVMHIAQAKPEVAEKLRDNYAKSLMSLSGLPQDEMDALMVQMKDLAEEMARQEDIMEADEGSDESMDEKYEDLVDDIIGDFFGFTDEELKANKERNKGGKQQKGPFGEEFERLFMEEEPESPAISDKEIKDVDKWLAKIFRKTAQVLHPDKESNPKKRAKKEQLMSDLLEAREAGDIMTVLTIYTKHANQGPAEVPEEMMAGLCQSLRMKLDGFQDKRFELLDRDPLNGFVYELLYVEQKKKQEKQLKLVLADLKRMAGQAEEDCDYLRNLSCLKNILAERYDFRQAQRFEFFS